MRVSDLILDYVLRTLNRVLYSYDPFIVIHFRASRMSFTNLDTNRYLKKVREKLVIL